MYIPVIVLKDKSIIGSKKSFDSYREASEWVDTRKKKYGDKIILTYNDEIEVGETYEN